MVSLVHLTKPQTDLQRNNSEQYATGNVDMLPTKNHRTASQLANQINEYKDHSQKPATSPRGADVVALLIPLEPHANAILQEGADQTETRHVWQDVLTMAEKLKDKTYGGHSVGHFIRKLNHTCTYKQ